MSDDDDGHALFAETVEQIEAELPPPSGGELAEAEYQAFIEKNLPRNFAGHFMHGMLGMTGFRIFNAPTFLPAYLHLIAPPGFSSLIVGVLWTAVGSGIAFSYSLVLSLLGAGLVVTIRPPGRLHQAQG